MKFKINDKVKLITRPKDLWCGHPNLKIGLVGIIIRVNDNACFATVLFEPGFQWDIWLECLTLYIPPKQKSKIKPVPCKKTISFRG